MIETIRSLAREKKAIILAHNYQPPEIQDIADLCGDSLELSIQASKTEADVIVFCGVHFMAETASILCPDKTVILPRLDAGCPMADTVTPETLAKEKERLGPIPVVTYVNSSAAVKALSDICCTSANVIDIVESLDADEVLMTPDKNLAAYAASRTAKTVHAWDGCCPYHDRLTPGLVEAARRRHPGAVFMAHPECPAGVLEMADTIQSTSGMIRFAAESDATSFIVGTETGLLQTLRKKNPAKKFHPASEAMVCEDMKKISLVDLKTSLETLTGVVRVPEEIRVRALGAVQRMIDR